MLCHKKLFEVRGCSLFFPFLLWQGGAKVQEAFYIFQELSEKYTSTVMLINGSAVCQMHMGQYEEAETLLTDALNRVTYLTLWWLFSKQKVLFSNSSLVSSTADFRNTTPVAFFCILFSGSQGCNHAC